MSPLRVNICFIGAAYRFDHLVSDSLEMYATETSVDKAINDFKTRVRKKLNLVNGTDIRLSGKLYVKYVLDYSEEYQLVKNKIKAVHVMPVPYTLLDNGKVQLPPLLAKQYKKSVVSIEEAKYLYLLTEELNPSPKYILITEDGEREDITKEIDTDYSKNSIVFNKMEFIYDADEGVYWLNGARYSDRIEVLNGLGQ